MIMQRIGCETGRSGCVESSVRATRLLLWIAWAGRLRWWCARLRVVEVAVAAVYSSGGRQIALVV